MTDSNNNTRWSYEDHEAFIRDLRAGLSDEEIADRLGRTTSALNRRAQLLTTLTNSRIDGIDLLRYQLASDPDYDWFATLAAAFTARGWQLPLTPNDRDLLMRAWEEQAPTLPELASILEREEIEVARQLIAYEIAMNIPEVIERLGVTPGTTLHTYAALASQLGTVQTWTLAISAERGPFHLTVHPSLQAARTHLEALIPDSPPTDALTCHWLIQRTSLANSSAQPHRSGSYLASADQS